MKDTHINLRVTPKDLELVDKAAALMGMSRSAFLLEASTLSAQRVLEIGGGDDVLQSKLVAIAEAAIRANAPRGVPTDGCTMYWDMGELGALLDAFRGH